MLAALAVAIRQLSGWPALNPVVVAMLLGVAVRTAIGCHPALKPGVRVSTHWLLRGAIVLLGLQVSLTEIAALGWGAALVCVAAVAATWIFTVRLGERLGVAPGLTRLIAAGTAICGASAVAAANSVVREGEERAAYAVASVTLFGTIAMLAYPVVGLALQMPPALFGLWAGASIHEVGQVVAAALAAGPATLDAAMISKLLRVLMLAPLVIWLARTSSVPGGAVVTPPWFILGFLGCACLSSFAAPPPAVLHAAQTVTTLLLAVAMAGLGLNADLRNAFAQGARPMALAAASSGFIALWALVGALLVSRPASP